MRKKFPWLEVVIISLAIVASLIYLGLSFKPEQQTLPVNSWIDEAIPIETNSVPSFEEIIKKDNPQNGPTQDQMRQLVKSIVDKELPDLTIVRPDIDALLEKANQNNATAQYDLGKIYFNGSWLPINEPLALNLFLKSAEQGNTDAMRWFYSYIIKKLIFIERVRSFLYEKKELPKGMSEKLQNTLQLLATYNEKAFVLKYRDSSKGDLLDRIADKKQPDYLDRLDSHRHQANLQSFPVTEENKAKVVTDTQHDTKWDRAKKGDIDALYLLGNFSFFNYFPEMSAFLIRAAQLGHIEAQFTCGFVHHSGFSMYDMLLDQKMPEGQRLNEAKKWYGQAADNGHSEAQCQLAEIELESGNYEIALKWYTKAAESGHDESLIEIMSLMNKYENMKTICLEALSVVVGKQKGFDSSTLDRVAWELAMTKNQEYCKQAVEVYEKLAENGDYSSCLYLGSIYSQKNGCLCEGFIEKDIEKAIYWYTKIDHEERLASLYLEQKEYDKSFPIFKRLAEKERDKCTIYSYWALGYSYFKGYGTVRDYYQAYKWLLIYNKYEPDYDVGFVEEKLSVEMISQAQQEAAKLAEVIDAYYEESEKRHKELFEQLKKNRESNWRYTEWREDIESISKILAQALPNASIPTSYDWIKAEKQE